MGIVVLRIPSALIEKANDPEGRYPEATLEYLALQQDAADLHSAKNSFMVMTSDVDEVTKTPLYDIKFLGVEGNQAQSFSTSEIIDRRNKSIYNTFLTSAILLGQGETGSYALSTSITSMHGLAVENNLLQKCNVINQQLGKRLLEINDIYLDYTDMPVFQPADPSEADIDVLSKACQRMKSSGGLTPAALKRMYELLNWPTEGIEDLTFDDGDTSRASQSDGTSGYGNTVATRDTSISNAEAKSFKNLTMDGDTLIDMATGAEVDID